MENNPTLPEELSGDNFFIEGFGASDCKDIISKVLGNEEIRTDVSITEL